MLNCGPVALATYSRITSKTDKDVAAKALKIYEIIGKKEGSAVSMLDLKEAAIACGFEVEPRVMTSDKLENLESYAIVYMPQSMPKVSRQSDPARIGHFVLVRFSDMRMFIVNPSTLEEIPLDISQYPQSWAPFSLILHDRSRVQSPSANLQQGSGAW